DDAVPANGGTATETEPAEEIFTDAESSITTGRPHEEFATRRGGRRRRRPSKKPMAANVEGENVEGGVDDSANGHDEANDAIENVEPQPPEAIMVEPAAMEEAPQTASRDPRRPSGRGRRRPTRREHKQPMITGRLREGQEILVQIAKEPIAKKGARITSHIALPGRYLVYMPTVEHLGVSRKIDSDSERTRLRKLIQKIHADEKVASGGFIVRTAGIGISETDLRADASYLVRAWQDIRRDAEKAKAPALIHRDLDLVQRILRDQLSEDFTAIRIDSEDEYQRVMQELQEALRRDKSPTKVLSFNDFGLVIMTRKRVKQSLERTLCTPCSYCQGAGLVKSPQTVCYEILEQARRLSKEGGDGSRQAMLRVNPEIARALRSTERDVLNEIEDYLGGVDISSDPRVHQEQFDFAFA